MEESHSRVEVRRRTRMCRALHRSAALIPLRHHLPVVREPDAEAVFEEAVFEEFTEGSSTSTPHPLGPRERDRKTPVA